MEATFKRSLMKEASFGVIPYRLDHYRYVYLLIQHHGGHWSFPKGHPNEGETALQTAMREFEEETGIKKYRIHEEPFFTETYIFQKGRTEVEKTVTYYLAHVLEDEVSIQAEEVRAYAWMTFEDGIKMITFDGSKQVLAWARNHLEH
jgi:8-oxo-dGTP pyrophosphatase MutT (NUDIX family)